MAAAVLTFFRLENWAGLTHITSGQEWFFLLKWVNSFDTLLSSAIDRCTLLLPKAGQKLKRRQCHGDIAHCKCLLQKKYLSHCAILCSVSYLFPLFHPHCSSISTVFVHFFLSLFRSSQVVFSPLPPFSPSPFPPPTLTFCPFFKHPSVKKTTAALNKLTW